MPSSNDQHLQTYRDARYRRIRYDYAPPQFSATDGVWPIGVHGVLQGTDYENFRFPVTSS